ncbi:hypothetical protein LCGC14_2146290 [marine sediment metagenome]|uniref:Uncharacterized protein n=1 Tax=marine sediment metagenome TaxID=412755 RepID=A0A0F9DX59_9ZZZZ
MAAYVGFLAKATPSQREVCLAKLRLAPGREARKLERQLRRLTVEDKRQLRKALIIMED